MQLCTVFEALVGGGGVGTYVPSLSFKTCRFVCGGSHVVVDIFLLYFLICICIHAVAVSTPCYVVCRHSCCLMSLFQGHVTCRNFTLTRPCLSELCILNPLVCLEVC